jgi:rubredoxin
MDKRMENNVKAVKEALECMPDAYITFRRVEKRLRELQEPVPMLLWCPDCQSRHIDEGKFAAQPHHTHACQSCGHVWRPAVVDTVGVRYLPGFKNEN